MKFRLNRKKLLYIILILIIGIGVYFRIQANRSPRVLSSIPEKPQITSLSSPLPQSVTIQNTAGAFAIASELPIYQITTALFPIDTFLTKYGMTKQISSTLWINETDGSGMSFSPRGQYYTYSTSLQEPPQNIGVQKEAILSLAQAYLQEEFPNSPLSILENQLEYLELGTDPHAPTTTPDAANAASIPFGYAISGYPVFIDNQLDAPIRILMRNDGKVVKATFPKVIMNVGTSQLVKTISPETALQNLANIQILTSQHSPNTAFSITNIDSITITGISLEYRASTQSLLLTPWYRMKAKATSPQDSAIILELLAPAIAIK